jgi:hypothetical protein
MIALLPRLRIVGLALVLASYTLAATLDEFNFDGTNGPCLQAVDDGDIGTLSSSCFFEFCGRFGCYTEECERGAETCQVNFTPHPSPTTGSRPPPPPPSPSPSPEPLPNESDPRVKFQGVIPDLAAIPLAAPGANKTFPSKSRLPTSLLEEIPYSFVFTVNKFGCFSNLYIR